MKTITIEELLQWAFVHELGKGGGVDGLNNLNSAWWQIDGSSWGMVASFADYLTVIDRDRAEPGIWIEQGAPHDDALEVGQAVKELADLDVVFPEGWSPLSDWPETYGLAEDAVAHAVSRYKLRSSRARQTHIIGLVISTAVLNRLPDYAAPLPEMQPISRNGKALWFMKQAYQDAFGRTLHIEVNGYNQKSKRPYNGAYQKHEFLSDPTADIMGRIDYQVWVAALKYLEASLMTRLVDHRLVHTDLPFTPWSEGIDGAGLVLQSAAESEKIKKVLAPC